MEYHNQLIGSNAEKLVIEELEDLGFKVNFVNSWYDLEVEKDEKKFFVEIKSTSLVLKNGSKGVRYGRFDFTKRKNVILQKKNNIIYIFVVYIKESYEVIGCIKAVSLDFKRYFTLNEVMSKRKLKSLENMFKINY